MCHLEALGIFPNAVHRTGHHSNLAHDIKGRCANFAASDAQTWRIIRANYPMAKTLFAIGKHHPSLDYRLFVAKIRFICEILHD